MKHTRIGCAAAFGLVGGLLVAGCSGESSSAPGSAGAGGAAGSGGVAGAAGSAGTGGAAGNGGIAGAAGSAGAGGAAGSGGVAGAAGVAGSGGTGGSPECNPGAKECVGKSARTCSTAGTWSSSEECPFLCSNGECTGSCEPGSRDCDGLSPRVCSATGTWSSSPPCTTACNDGFCNDACVSVKVPVSLEPANILYLVDRTGSMNCNAPPTQTTSECNVTPKKKDATQPSKWETVRDALIAALNGLTTTPAPSVGMMLFNSNDSCGVSSTPEVDVAQLNDAQLNALGLALSAVVPKGDTPIVAAAMSSYAFMYAQSYVGDKFVVLLTDGTETCDPFNTGYLVQKAEEASLVGIRTFVIGAPGSEVGRGLLSRIAFAGGTASSSGCDHTSADPTVGDCHMDLTLPGQVFEDELAAALQKVSGVAQRCEFEIPAPGSIDPDQVNVSFTAGGGATMIIPRDDLHPCDATSQGWAYTDTSKTAIVVCGASCEAIKSDAQGAIAVELGCPTQIAP